VAPLERTDIALVAEDLVIDLEPDARHYRVRARYLLGNPGGAKSVLFGVPFFQADALALRRDTPAPERGPGEGWVSQAQAMATVEITTGGQRTGCRPGKPPRRVERPEGDTAAPLPAPDAWCVARVAIAGGDEVPLELRYRGELEFVDGEVSSSAIYNYGERTLRYDFSAAGYWAGRPREVKVALRLGALAGAPVQSDPPADHATAEELRWSFRDVDLRVAKPLAVLVSPVRLLEQRQILREGVTLRRRRARASSTLAARYAAASAVDGSAATAWCEGDPGDGQGAWIEVAFEPRRQDRGGPVCAFEGVAVVPGYAKPGAYLDNGRVRRLRVTDCGRSDGGLQLDLGDLDPLPQSAARLLPVRGEPAFTADMHACFRLTILDVEPGRRFHDTCLSAVFPIFNCESIAMPLAPRPPPF
jgi:hypothetical protein